MMKAVVTIFYENSPQSFEAREMAELAEMTRNFDNAGINYSIDYVTEF